MAKMDEDEAYKVWTADIKNRLPEQKRSHLEAIVDEEGTRELFKGGMREADYYRRLNEVHERNSELQNAREAFLKQAMEQNQWYEKASKEYEAAMRLVNKKRTDDDDLDSDATGHKSSRPAVEPSELEEFRRKSELVDRFDKTLPQFVGQMASLTKRLVTEGFDVDPMEVVNYAGQNGIPPLQAYEYLTKDERETRAAQTREKELAEARDEGRRDERSKLQSPDRIRYPSADAGPAARLFEKTAAGGPDLSDRATRATLAREEWYKMQDGTR